MPRYVVDKSCFQDSKFSWEKFLSKHEILSSDFFFMESHYANGKRNLQSTLSVVRPRPERFVVLKDTSKIIQMTYNGSRGRQRRLIDRPKTRKQKAIIAGIFSDSPGKDEIFANHEQRANSFIDGLLPEAKAEIDKLPSVQKEYTRADITKFGVGELTEDTIQKILELSLKEMTEYTVYKGYRLPKPSEVAGFFIFRATVAINLLRLYWFSHGLNSEIVSNFKNFRNDITDLMYIVIASYFDGYKTCETKMKFIWKMFIKTVKLFEKYPNNKFNLMSQQS